MNIRKSFIYRAPLVLMACFICAASLADTTLDEAATMTAEGRVTVSNVSGSVTVSGWDRNEVRLTGELAPGVKRIEFESDGRNVSIDVVHADKGHRDGKRKGSGWDWNSKDRDADLVIRVPRRAQLEIDTTSADVNVTEHTGPQLIKSVSGDIDLTLSEVESSATSISGSVNARGRDVSIDAQLESVSGDVELVGFRGDLEIETVSGDIEIRDARIRDGDFESVSGDVDLRMQLASNGSMEVETISGDVSLEFEGVIDVTIRVATHSGTLDDFFGVEAERTRRYGPGRRLRSSSGEGNADVTVSTLSGDVRNRTRD